MALPIDKLGTTYGPATAVIDPTGPRRTRRPPTTTTRPTRPGKFAPPVFGVVPVWSARSVSRAPTSSRPRPLMFIVHGEQDMHFHQPLRAGHRAGRRRPRVHSVRVGGSGTRLVVQARQRRRPAARPVAHPVRHHLHPGHDRRRVRRPGQAGPRLPRGRPDTPGRRVYACTSTTTRPTATATRRATRCRSTSTTTFAKRSACPASSPTACARWRCAARRSSSRSADGDPGRLRRLAVRFAANVFPGNDVEVELYDAGSTAEGTRGLRLRGHVGRPDRRSRTAGPRSRPERGIGDRGDAPRPWPCSGCSPALVRPRAPAVTPCPAPPSARCSTRPPARYGDRFSALLESCRVWVQR